MFKVITFEAPPNQDGSRIPMSLPLCRW